ncbi:RhuM family protein (plasmid) [Parabacteroides distasonis]|uniref:RhuM family protein n=1 Tax=Parabacteroides distasonis TaxID=823 RepID=A0AAX3QZ89_PARDI|nr:RhuM family protein [Parabacteroides distasonis]WET66703.1 RhuM family protein [Parabacteroides distasonis]
MEKQGEIILYQPDEAVRLEVRLEDETVWLTQAQIAELFQRDRTVITKHINNVFKEKELEEKSNVHFLHIANSDKPVKFFSLDVIISVGYRVKSVRGTQFRQWANKILKEYLLKGYSINQRLNDMEYRMNNKFFQIEKTFAEHDAKIDFFVRTSLPPVEGIFFDGQIFDAYKFATDLIKSAKCSLILIDNYVDESVLLMLSKRNIGVSATIYTQRITQQLQLDLDRHNSQYPPIDIRTYRDSHDRFLIIDNTEVYHIGASLKDLGKKMFAFSKLELPVHTIIDVL